MYRFLRSERLPLASHFEIRKSFPIMQPQRACLWLFSYLGTCRNLASKYFPVLQIKTIHLLNLHMEIFHLYHTCYAVQRSVYFYFPTWDGPDQHFTCLSENAAFNVNRKLGFLMLQNFSPLSLEPSFSD